MSDYNKELFEHAFKEVKEDISEIKSEIKQIRRDIFGNGSPGMCTKRQNILKVWIEKEIREAKAICEKEIKHIKKVPATIYTWIFRIGTITGLFVNAGIFMFIAFKYINK